MRNLLKGVCVAAALTAVATPALSQQMVDERYPHTYRYAAPVAGAVVGTAVGVGLYNGWYGSGAFVSAFPVSAAGAAVVGGVAGVGTVVLIDAFTQKCAGFQAILGMNKAHCVNGEYVADRAPRHHRRVARR